MTPIQWLKEAFIVVDGWQTVHLASLILARDHAPWIVIARRHPEGQKWYLFTRDEFLSHLPGKAPSMSVEDAFRLREYLASEVFPGKGPRGSDRQFKELRLPSPNRVVVIDKETGTVKQIGLLEPPKPATIKVLARRRASVKLSRQKKSTLPREPRLAVVGEVFITTQEPREAARTTPTKPARLKKNAAYTLVPVYFGTDRMPEATEGSVDFSAVRDPQGQIHFGSCHVSVPATHTVGELESPKWYRFEFRSDPKSHLMVWDTSVLDQNAFFREVRAQARLTPTKDAFIFVHGYNVTFTDAIRRTGQMAYDLDFLGPAILFSWPSGGRLAGFFPDEAAIDVSTEHLKRFLDQVLRRSGAETIHIIAHSMGNRALLPALLSLAESTDVPRIHNVILAAPDIDKQRFEQIARQITGVQRRLTLYASSRDKALLASRKIHAYPRAGESGKNLVILPRLDTIDASNVDTDFLAHSYALSDPRVLNDVYAMLHNDLPPARRFGLKKRTTAGSKSYCEFKRDKLAKR